MGAVSGTIVVGVDGSASSEAALRWALAQAGVTGDAVRAVIAWTPPAAHGWIPVPADLDVARNARSTLERSVTAARDGVGGPDVEQRVIEGHPAQVLLDAADDGDLLVVGCRGNGGFTGAALGSVSLGVVAGAPCPVVVVHDASATSPA